MKTGRAAAARGARSRVAAPRAELARLRWPRSRFDAECARPSAEDPLAEARSRAASPRPSAARGRARSCGRRSGCGCRARRSSPACGRRPSSGSQRSNSPSAIPAAISSANHACSRAYSSSATGRSSGWRTARSHSSTHSTQSSRSDGVVGRHWPIIDPRRSACEAAGGLAVGDPRVAGAGVGPVERLGEQGLAAGEVVVHERRRDARRPSRSARSGRRRSLRSRSAARRRRGSARVPRRLARRGLTRVLVASERRGQVSADPVREPRDAALAPRQRAATVAAGRQALLDVVDQIDVLVEHERVESLVGPLHEPRAGAACRPGGSTRTRRSCRPTPSGSICQVLTWSGYRSIVVFG